MERKCHQKHTLLSVCHWDVPGRYRFERAHFITIFGPNFVYMHRSRCVTFSLI